MLSSYVNLDYINNFHNKNIVYMKCFNNILLSLAPTFDAAPPSSFFALAFDHHVWWQLLHILIPSYNDL